MISVVMPYWRRQDILALNLSAYRDLYPHEDIEIVVVDDGSPEPAEIFGAYPWPVNVVRLPAKEIALNPCVAFNAGVAASCGEIVVLTNPEVIHRAPILSGARSIPSEGLTLTLNFPLRVSAIRAATSSNAMRTV